MISDFRFQSYEFNSSFVFTIRLVTNKLRNKRVNPIPCKPFTFYRLLTPQPDKVGR